MAAVKRSDVRHSPSRRPGRRVGARGGLKRVAVENVNHPGSIRTVDASRYHLMRRAVLKVLPARAPGFTLADTLAAVLPHLPPSLFPGGAGAGWWFKTVQLDLEAKRIIVRVKSRPLRVHRR